MTSLDGLLSRVAAGHGGAIVVLVAFALGLRHASDPDHLVAVSTLVASTRERAARTAARLGAAWGAGHALTLLAFGLPVLLLRTFLPAWFETAAEAAIGVIIVALAVRLLLRWRSGAFHAHEHEHDGARHVHLHSHARVDEHVHGHRVRTPRQAFAIGLVHGAAGSGGVAVLIVAAVPSTGLAVVALLVLVCGAALSMTLLSAAVGRAFSAGPLRRLFVASVPALGSGACAFGVWYCAQALRAL